MKTIDETAELLNKIRDVDNLEKFRSDKGNFFCKENNITGMQLNFLLSIIAVERHEKLKTS